MSRASYPFDPDAGRYHGLDQHTAQAFREIQRNWKRIQCDRVPGPGEILARITAGPDVDGLYEWEEIYHKADNTFAALTGGRTHLTNGKAKERSGSASTLTGKRITLELSADPADNVQRPSFDAPSDVAATAADTTPAYLADKIAPADDWITEGLSNPGGNEIVTIGHNDPQARQASRDISAYYLVASANNQVTLTLFSYYFDSKGHRRTDGAAGASTTFNLGVDTKNAGVTATTRASAINIGTNVGTNGILAFSSAATGGTSDLYFITPGAANRYLKYNGTSLEWATAGAVDLKNAGSTVVTAAAFIDIISTRGGSDIFEFATSGSGGSFDFKAGTDGYFLKFTGGKASWQPVTGALDAQELGVVVKASISHINIPAIIADVLDFAVDGGGVTLAFKTGSDGQVPIYDSTAGKWIIDYFWLT